MNFHRAYLRSELIARGCPGEIIDAFMGHANRGELPFLRYSTFDYEKYRQQILGYLESIQTSLDSEPLCQPPAPSRFLINGSGHSCLINYGNPWAGIASRYLQAGLKICVGGSTGFRQKIRMRRFSSDKTGVETSLADARNAEALEIEVIRQVGLKQLSKREAADWLRLLYLAEERWNATNAIPIAHTRLARLPAAQPSPFKKDNISHLPRVEAWRQALQTALRTDAITSSAQLLKAATLLSALLFGALIDSKKLCILGKFAGQPASQAGGYRYLEFNLPYAGMGNHHTQRWYPDPMTACYSGTRPPDRRRKWHGCPWPTSNLSCLPAGWANPPCLRERKICSMRRRHGGSSRWRRSTFTGFNEVFLVHSIHPRTWRRLHAQEIIRLIFPPRPPLSHPMKAQRRKTTCS